MAGADLSEGVVVMSGDQGIAGKIEELKDKAEAIGEKLIAEGKEAVAVAESKVAAVIAVIAGDRPGIEPANRQSLRRPGANGARPDPC